ncbi:uncharacterized protein LOC144142490 [Haemaphysalis longicornis]
MWSAKLILWLASIMLATASVQRPVLTSCSESQQVRLSDVTITNATIGNTMVISYRVTNSKPLTSNPTLVVTVWKENGSKIGCFFNTGSCAYKLCGGTSWQEQAIGEMWGNRCPVPAFDRTLTTSSALNGLLSFLIGWPPTTLKMQVEVTDGGETLGCYNFKAKIDKSP